MKEFVLWLLAMMMESASNIAIERITRFSFMWRIQTSMQWTGTLDLFSRCFTFDEGLLLHGCLNKL